MVRSGSPMCIGCFSVNVRRSLRWEACSASMLGGGLDCDDSVADQALAHVLIEDVEHLADSIGMDGCSDVIIL